MPLPDAAGQTNFFAYNNYNQLIATTNALGQVTTMAYDANGYLTNITGALPGATTSYTYDGCGRVRTVSRWAIPLPPATMPPTARPTFFTPMGRIGRSSIITLIRSCKRPDGDWLAQVYDPLRHLTDMYDNLGRHTHYEYCTCGALNSITDPLGRLTTFLRDLQNRVTSKIYPDGTALNYAYQPNSGRLQSVTDAKGQTTEYQFFIDNNLAQVSYTNAAVATPSVSFTYDTNYNHRLTMTDGIGTTAYSYYAVTSGQLGAGQLQGVDGPFANDTIAYNYDALGRVTSRAINGMAQQVTYDALGRETMVTNALGSFTKTYVGTTLEISTNYYPNGQQTVFSYFKRQRSGWRRSGIRTSGAAHCPSLITATMPRGRSPTGRNRRMRAHQLPTPINMMRANNSSMLCEQHGRRRDCIETICLWLRSGGQPDK